MATKILIADDHPMVRRSIRLICKNKKIDLPDEIESCRELLRALKKEAYTHLILDLLLSDGSSLTLIPQIFDAYPNLKILVYSMQPEALHANTIWQKFGVQYLPKNEKEIETIKRITEFLLDQRPPAPKSMDQDNPFHRLSPREKDILPFLIEGYSTKDIADRFDIADNTVRTLKKRILDKTAARDVAALRKLAAYHKI